VCQDGSLWSPYPATRRMNTIKLSFRLRNPGCVMRTSLFYCVLLSWSISVPLAAAENVFTRIERAVTALDNLHTSIRARLEPQELAEVECAVVIPRFHRGAAVSGEVFPGGLLLETGFGRGFISCRQGEKWAAPSAVTLEGGSRAIQIGEDIDVVILSMENSQGSSGMLARHLCIGADCHSGGAFDLVILDSQKIRSDRIDFDGAVIKLDNTAEMTLYRRSARKAKSGSNVERVPESAQIFVAKLSALFGRW